MTKIVSADQPRIAGGFPLGLNGKVTTYLEGDTVQAGHLTLLDQAGVLYEDAPTGTPNGQIRIEKKGRFRPSTTVKVSINGIHTELPVGTAFTPAANVKALLDTAKIPYTTITA